MVDDVVDRDHRGETAGAEAARHLEGELAVFGRLAHVDAQLLLERVEHGHPAAHVAGRAQADADEVAAPRHGGEERVEADHPGHLAVGLVHPLGDVLEGDLGEIPEDPLGQLQHGDQRPRLVLVAVDHLVEPGEELLLGGLLAAARAAAVGAACVVVFTVSSVILTTPLSVVRSVVTLCRSLPSVTSPSAYRASRSAASLQPARATSGGANWSPDRLTVNSMLGIGRGHDHDGGGHVPQRGPVHVAQTHVDGSTLHPPSARDGPMSRSPPAAWASAFSRLRPRPVFLPGLVV